MRVRIAVSLAFLLNSLYLALSAAPSLFHYANVALHVVLGPVLVVAAAWWVAREWAALPASGRAAALLLGAAGASGMALAATGATHQFDWLVRAHLACSASGVALALAWVVVHVQRRRPAHADRSPRLRSRWAPAASGVLVVCATAVTVLAASWSLWPALHARTLGAGADRIVNPAAPPPDMNGEGAGSASPFFPSSAETNVGGIIPANFFMTGAACGRCHQDIYEQWRSSAHHFSSFNNQWYRRSIEYMQDVVGTRPSKWCAGCHDHAVFFNGRFDRPIKEQINTPEAQAGLTCTSCHAITRVKSTMGQGDFTIEYPPLHDLAASDRPALRFVHDRLLYLDPRPHRLTFLKSFHQDQTPEFCSACHKVHLDVPVNSYRWFRGFNEYDGWQASGVSGEGARSFYYPPAPQKCADCHMPLVASTDPAAKQGRIHSHRFIGANTALPYVNRDAEQLRLTRQFLQDGQITVDVFGLVRGDQQSAALVDRPVAGAEAAAASTFAVGEESANFGAARAVLAPPAPVIGPLDKVAAVVRPGESVRIEVVVRTRKVGHFFPGGTVDAFDVWVELEVLDSRRRTILHSGALEGTGAEGAGGGESGPVDPSAHFYRSLLLDEHGNPINKRNAWAARSVAYVRLIPPGATDTVHYRLRVPEDAGDRLTVRARVNYRKFSWWNTGWSFAGVRAASAAPRIASDASGHDHAVPAAQDPAVADGSSARVAPGYDDGRWVFEGDTSHVSGLIKHVPDLPVTVMAHAEATLRVLPRGTAPPEEPRVELDRSVRERWNDYGIGLLLQGDLKGAEAAFLKVTAMDPGYADGWVNVARARLQEGNMAGAEEMLRRALSVDPALAKTHFFLGTVLKSLGRYDEALEHLRAASVSYPRDRVVLDQIGRVLFLQRKYSEAAAVLSRVLAIDPEDLQAHYTLMLCDRGLGRADAAAREEQLYRRFKADEASQAITGPYRLLHAEDNNERQAIHEHLLQPVSRGSVYGRETTSPARTRVSCGGYHRAGEPR